MTIACNLYRLRAGIGGDVSPVPKGFSMSDIKSTGSRRPRMAPYADLGAITHKCLSAVTPLSLALFLGVHNAHVYRARKGDYTPGYQRAMRRSGLWRKSADRPRFNCEIPGGCDREVFKEAMRQYVPKAARLAREE